MDTLAGIADDVNRQFTKDVEESGRFMTLFLADVDAPAGTLKWVRAGHDPALLYDPETGVFEELSGPGLPLGVMEDGGYREMSRPVRPGQMMVIGTDGIWEARDAEGRVFGKQRFKDLIAANARRSAAGLADLVMTEVHEFTSPRAQEDDVTVVIVKIGS
jgi:sigma-B regulation protein RsbU (phosphoserine phosphatase)